MWWELVVCVYVCLLGSLWTDSKHLQLLEILSLMRNNKTESKKEKAAVLMGVLHYLFHLRSEHYETHSFSLGCLNRNW